MPVQTLTPNALLDSGNWEPSSEADITSNLSDGDTGTTVINTSADQELSDGTDVISATSFEVSSAGTSNEVTATASSLSLSEDNVNGIKLTLTTANETQAIFTDIKLDVTYSKTSTTGPGGKVQIIYGKVEIQNGKVEL